MQHITELTRTRPTPPLRGLTVEQPPAPKSPERVTLAQLEPRNETLTAAIDAARAWSRRLTDHPEASLILSSQSKGVGKTHIAKSCWWSQYFTAKGYECPSNPFFMADQLSQMLHGADVQRAALRSMIAPGRHRFVVIDDLGIEQNLQYVSGENQTRSRQSIWYNVINHCYESKIGLVITTNLEITKQLPAWVGDAAFDRLMEMAPAGFMIDLSSVSSYRREKSGRGNA